MAKIITDDQLFTILDIYKSEIKSEASTEIVARLEKDIERAGTYVDEEKVEYITGNKFDALTSGQTADSNFVIQVIEQYFGNQAEPVSDATAVGELITEYATENTGVDTSNLTEVQVADIVCRYINDLFIERIIMGGNNVGSNASAVASNIKTGYFALASNLTAGGSVDCTVDISAHGLETANYNVFIQNCTGGNSNTYVAGAICTVHTKNAANFVVGITNSGNATITTAGRFEYLLITTD